STEKNLHVVLGGAGLTLEAALSVLPKLEAQRKGASAIPSLGEPATNALTTEQEPPRQGEVRFQSDGFEAHSVLSCCAAFGPAFLRGDVFLPEDTAHESHAYLVRDA